MGRTRINSIIVYCFMFLGMLISAYICFAKARTVIKHDVCIHTSLLLGYEVY
jgi:hypothetical protein